MNNQNTELITRKNINETPFQLIKTENGYFIALGKYRITEYLNSETEAFDKLITNQWDITIQLITLIAEEIINKSLLDITQETE